jgi:hypothetical protein
VHGHGARKKLRHCLDRLLDRMRAHEDAETDLLREAWQRDLGSDT